MTGNNLSPIDEARQASYVPELDGLRGCAILMVLIYHCGAPVLGGGFIGVDVFFVLSGFLITSLLLKESEITGGVDLKRFYTNRLLRLFPALLFMLTLFLVVSIIRFEGGLLRAKFIEALIVLFYAANWARAFGFYTLDTFGHAWSLSIEEQFYILWPALLIFMSGFARSRKRLALGIMSLALLSWGVRVYLAAGGASPGRIYNGLDTRADCLLVGCLLAVVLGMEGVSRLVPKLEKLLRFGAPFAALVLAAGTIFFNWKSKDMAYWGFTVVELCAAVIIADISLSRRSIVKRGLSARPLVWVGRISYGIYLWHVPVYLLVLRAGLKGFSAFLAAVAATFLGAYLSYRLLERPFLRLKTRYPVNARSAVAAV